MAEFTVVGLLVVIGCTFTAGFSAAVSGFGQNIMFQVIWIGVGLMLNHDTIGDLVSALAIMNVMSAVIAVALGLQAMKYNHCVWGIVAGIFPTLNCFIFLGNYLAVTMDQTVLKLILGIIFLIFGMGQLSWQTYGAAKQNLSANPPLVVDSVAPDESKLDVTIGDIHVHTEDDSAMVPKDEKLWNIPKPTCEGTKDWLSQGKTWGALFTGVCSGLISGMFGTGGPPIMIYFATITIAKAQIRGTAQVESILTIPLRVVSALIFGIFKVEEIPYYCVSPFAAMLGMYVGNKLHYYVDEKFVRNILYFLIVISSAIMTAPDLTAPFGIFLLVCYVVGFCLFMYLLVKWAKRVKHDARDQQDAKDDIVLETK